MLKLSVIALTNRKLSYKNSDTACLCARKNYFCKNLKLHLEYVLDVRIGIVSERRTLARN